MLPGLGGAMGFRQCSLPHPLLWILRENKWISATWIKIKTSWWFQHLWQIYKYISQSQNGNLPQISVKIINIWNHHPVELCLDLFYCNVEMFLSCLSSSLAQGSHWRSILAKNHDSSMPSFCALLLAGARFIYSSNLLVVALTFTFFLPLTCLQESV